MGCKVEFYGDGYGFTVRFYRHCGEGWANYESVSNDKGSTNKETTLETTLETTFKQSTRDKILQLMQENPGITTDELSLLIDISKDGIKYHLKKLRSEGIIKRDGSTKSGKWIVYPKNI